METLSSLESFIRSAETGSFSAAARRLSLTPGAVSKNVAKLEAGLGVRLFQRSTRSLTLTEAGEQLLAQAGASLDQLQAALAHASSASGEPAGTLKVGMAMAFGRDHLLPLLPEFLRRYPHIRPDWRLDNRQVDLIGEGYDAAIGGGIHLAPGIVVRELAKVHLILVASPAYLAGRRAIHQPEDLHGMEAILRYSQTTNRVTPWHLRSRAGQQLTVEMTARATLNDPEALCHAALMGLGITHVPVPHASGYLQSGQLVRVLPEWYSEGGNISLYFAAKKLLPAKTRVFVDYVVEHFRTHRLAEQWAVDK